MALKLFYHKPFKVSSGFFRMRIAIFHNFLDNIGGAEYVDLLLARKLHADIYTTNIDSEKIRLMGFSDVLPRIHSIGRVPLHAPFRQEATYFLFRTLDVQKRFKKKYDLYFLGGDWAMAGGRHNHPNVWYVYSPTREIYDLSSYVRSHMVPWYQRPFFDLWVKGHRLMNRRDLPFIDSLITISSVVQSRVRNYLGRESSIIYPPTDVSRFISSFGENYWLSVNRLINHKRVALQIEAFRSLPHERLVIVGSYEQSAHFRTHAQELLRSLPPNVEIRSWVSEEELLDLYARCKGFITTSKEEDYGMNVVEAMASGKIVLAPAEGGYLETVVDGVTGELIPSITSDKLREAILRWSEQLSDSSSGDHYREDCIRRAKKFDVDNFVKQLLSSPGIAPFYRHNL